MRDRAAVARQAHNLEVGGSIPSPATNKKVMIISDIEWNEFVDNNTVSDDVIEVIALRIKFGYELTDRENAIYEHHSDRIEKKIKTLK